MYFIDAASVLLRRWYVVLLGGLLMAGGAAVVMTHVPTDYQASGQMVLLLPPGASGTGKPVNPYLNLQSGLTTAASLVAGSVQTKDVQRDLADLGFESDYAVAVDPGTGPLVTLVAKDTDPVAAMATRDEVMVRIDNELKRIQDEVGVPESQYIRTTRSSVSSRAEVLPGAKLRALAGVAVIGLILTLVGAFGVDRLLRRRSARRGSEAIEPPEEEPARAPDPVQMKAREPKVSKTSKASKASKVSTKQSDPVRIKRSKPIRVAAVIEPSPLGDGNRFRRPTGSDG